jgi:AcrR family transcriptional regulator
MSSNGTPSAEEEPLSPNQLAKRDEIINATVELLLREGVHSCTVRSIATASGISNGSVHYYFDDVDEVIDLAMLAAIRAWVDLIRADAEASTESPHEVFWWTMSSCLEPFARGDRILMPLWLEYWTFCVRRAHLAPIHDMQELLISAVARLLDSAGAEDSDARALGLTSYLFGVGMQQSVWPISWETVAGHITALSGLDSPTSRPASP